MSAPPLHVSLTLKESDTGAVSSPSKARFIISISRPILLPLEKAELEFDIHARITTSHAQCKWGYRWREPIVTFHDFV
jgi:hypothetical protein